MNDDHSDEFDRSDDPAKLPADQIVTAQQLEMRPGQKIREKAKELGCSQPTLKLWHAEWRGSGFDPDYVIRRRNADWLRTKWKDRDWCEALRLQIARQQHRHPGDLLLDLGITSVTAQDWSRRHVEFGNILWAEPRPKNHFPTFLCYLRYSSIDDYRKRKAAYIASGMNDTEAMHLAADEAVNALRYKTAQRRRIERDTLLGVGGHEETLRRYRKGAKLTDAYSKRIAKKLFTLSRWASMERALNEVGYAEAETDEMMSELMGAFKESETAGQAKWKQVRDAVLRRRAAADAFAKAETVEASVMQKYAEQFGGKHVKKWVEKKYGGATTRDQGDLAPE